ncbi:hypothetical protein [Streptomyces sp. NRRL S-350]|uniref:hypothetical protein n=1 Tax=Streptomyces sp. NRRL S-350 TaxID=1463902 RepID=UPI0004C18715|nr:hypothetical protein [Streptomyces sp. NRRL S-350]
MRANHATKPQEPVPRGDAGARRGIVRWLPRPRTAAAGGALLAQLWGLGATGAYAAAAGPLPEPAQPAVRRALHGAPALDAPAHGAPALGGPALDGQSAERPVGRGQSAPATPDRSPAPVPAPGPAPAGEPTGAEPATTAATAAGSVNGTLQERIRAGGLPLPGQRAAVPDAFAIASGLTDTVPAQPRPAETRASREGLPVGLPTAGRVHPDTVRSADAGRAEPAEAPPVQEAASTAVTAAGPDADRAGVAVDPAIPAAPGGGTPETLAVTDAATVTPVTGGPTTATAVLAPIAAGLLLTGAAMCKHRGLPSGH